MYSYIYHKESNFREYNSSFVFMDKNNLFSKWICMLYHFSCVQLFCDPMDCSRPDSSVHGILKARILEWVAMHSSKGSSRSKDGTHVSYVSCIGRRALYHQHHLGSPKNVYSFQEKKNAFVNIKINFCVSGFSYQLISHKVSSWDRLKNLEIEVMNIFSAMTAVFTKVIFISNFKGWRILYRYIYSLEISIRNHEIYGI